LLLSSPKGVNHSVSTACTTGLHAVGDASRFIRHGDVDVMVCGGTEACVGPVAVAGFARMRALSTDFNDRPTESSQPFDRDRNGFVISEGAGILVLEELEHARRRNAKVFGEILGYGLSGDASHVTAPSADGDGAYRCMRAALRDAGVGVDDVGHINAHATSTPLGDAAEVCAIERLFPGGRETLGVSSTKGATGHLLGAAGAVETIFTVLACRDGVRPWTVNLENADVGVELRLLRKGNDVNWVVNGEVRRRVALTNSFGFGGTNASLCVGSFEEW
jgi:3-oxoacyl-[acyl-carrier-protein] synthase II